MMSPKHLRCALVLLATASLTISGCEDEVVQSSDQAGGDKPADAPAEKKKPAAKKPAPKADKDEEEPADYKRPDFPGQSKRDPFVFTPPEPKLDEDADEQRTLEPLEQFALSSLRLVGIVTGSAVPTAMFVDNTGFGHIAKEGDRIGTDGGRITDIRTNEVEITVNVLSTITSDGELEGDDDDVEETEPQSTIILLSDTEIPLPSEEEAEEAEEDEALLRELTESDNAADGGSPRRP